ncbi:hypothetical protein [Breznakiella homolactica]|uniref:Tetratricopeptide repeat protein n=1 Tax=Breznakiella homolactica TaxID=2798577 RepID=A0A7T7XK84_9SPIR|nr:hypothetical protein [Breznakiella homolactica]QQO07944.1 hypothetical protein JFL75_13460 [Breznakiella homolactica]
MNSTVRRNARILAAALLILPLVPAVSQESGPAMASAKGFNYEVISEGGEAAAEKLVRQMDLRFEVYNRVFRFTDTLIAEPLKVRAFESEEHYNDYITSRLGRPREGCVYLHYQRPERRELVVYRNSEASERLLSHQGFIQFLRAFVPNPPSWLRDGFAIYFSTLSFDQESGSIQYEENLAWLNTVKSWGGTGPSMEAILMADIEGIPENFAPASWALISFLLNSGNEDYRRTLFESFMVLSPSASAAENSMAVMARMRNWINSAALKQDYDNYLESRRTFAELVDLGRTAYTAKETIMAELYFLNALELKPTHYAPYYYLGLLAYEEKSYELAEHYYRSALQYGADPALLNYALGLNALSSGRPVEAKALLREASRLAPDRYKDRVDEMLERIP